MEFNHEQQTFRDELPESITIPLGPNFGSRKANVSVLLQLEFRRFTRN